MTNQNTTQPSADETKKQTRDWVSYLSLVDQAVADPEYQHHVVETVAENDADGCVVTFEGSTCILVPTGYLDLLGGPILRPPMPGDHLRLYGRGLGYRVRGIALTIRDAVVGVYRYASVEEDKAAFARDVEEKKEADRRAWDAAKDETVAKVAALPEPFRKRFEFFARRLDWGPQFGKYEIFVMQEAVKIYTALSQRPPPDASPQHMTEMIEAFQKMASDAQHFLVPDLDKDHSGNTFGCAVALAHLYAQQLADTSDPPAVEVYQQHGAMCPLVGCESCGCYSTTTVAVKS